jgi:transcriptional regulator with PAS, ATPase and Fis domain
MGAGGRVPELAAARIGRQPARSALPPWMRPEWLEPLIVKGEHVGTLLVVPPSSAGRSRGAPGLAAPAASPARRSPTADAFARLVTADADLLDAIAKARQLARGRTPVLLLGEKGVGKEEFARGIHGDSGGPYVALNCGGLSRELLASELFGYAEGAFTGARKGGMTGKIEAAKGGTLFLDEIGEMPADMQPNLLRVLEQGEIYRLGENSPRRVDFRLVTATHRDLRKEIAAGRFRMDLFYRIAVTSLRIPPLRDRKGDIELLARHFLERFRREQGQPAGDIAPEVLGLLQSYAWPGNVRELRNLVEGAVLLSEGPVLTRQALPREFIESCELPAAVPAPGVARSMAEGEEMLIRNAIAASGGNLTLAARQLGIAKSTLYVKLQRYGLSR